MTNKIVTWNNNFFTEENKSALRQSKQLRMRTKSAQSIITKSCHSLQFIAISQRSVNKLSAQLISYLHLILYVVIMRKFTSLQNSAPDKNSPFWVVSEHLTPSITKIPTGAFAKCFANIRRHPLKPRGPKQLLTLPIGCPPLTISLRQMISVISKDLQQQNNQYPQWHWPNK